MRAHISTVLRRSVVLPRTLVQEAREVAHGELRDNLNRLVKLALTEFVQTRRARRLEEEVARMARDPALRSESETITGEFLGTERDGLPDR